MFWNANCSLLRAGVQLVKFYHFWSWKPWYWSRSALMWNLGPDLHWNQCRFPIKQAILQQKSEFQKANSFQLLFVPVKESAYGREAGRHPSSSSGTASPTLSTTRDTSASSARTSNTGFKKMDHHGELQVLILALPFWQDLKDDDYCRV